MSVQHPVVTTSNALTYYQQRMLEIGSTEQNNIIKLCNPEADHPANLPTNFQIFNEYQGNVEILFYNLKREVFPYLKFGTGKTASVNAKNYFYKITRIAKPVEDGKYKFPAAQGTNLKEQGIKNPPFIPPSLVEAYETKKEIKRLILTEGAFKAFRASEIAKIPTVGGTSMTHFFDSDGKLHSDIFELIYNCNVKEIMILWDGDCLNISDSVLNDTYLSEPLNKRPLGFYLEAKKIREAILAKNKEWKEKAGDKQPEHLVEKVFLAHPNKDQPKGLDDLLNAVQNDKKVFDSIMSSKSNAYFTILDITKGVAEMQRHFKLHDVQVFYDAHHELIGSTKFKFNEDIYQFSNEEDELVLLEPGWAKRFHWVKNRFYEEMSVPMKFTERMKLEEMEKVTLKDLYGDDFSKYLRPRYCSNFCNIPDNTEGYQRITFNSQGLRFYNRYHPFQYKPVAGDYPLSMKMIKHMFGSDILKDPETGERFESWEMGLDYITLLLMDPTTILPVLCFMSKENRTGKGTFVEWISKMFKNNAVLVSNNDFKSDFNSLFADKLLIICEETLLDKKNDSERIKAMATASEISVNTKNAAQFSVDFFGKFIFCSNNEKMIYVTEHDDRYWVRYVKKFEGKEIVRFADRLVEEIPHFVHFLMNRPLRCKRVGRSYFDPVLYMTKTLRRMVTLNEGKEAANMRSWLADAFMENSSQTIEMPLKEIKINFFKEGDSDEYVREILERLKVSLELKPDGTINRKRGSYVKKIRREMRDDKGQLNGYEEVPIKINTIGTHYIFKREDFADPNYTDELQEFDEILKSTLPVPDWCNE